MSPPASKPALKVVSLRLRLMRLTALCLCAVLLTSFVATAFILNEREEDLIDQMLEEQLDADINQYSPEAGLLQSSVPRMQFYAFTPGHPDEALLPAYLRGVEPGKHEIDVGDTEYHYVVRDEGGRRFVLAYDAEQYEDSFTDLMVILAVAFLVVMVLSVTVIYVLGRRALRHIESLAAAVKNPTDNSFLHDGMEAEVRALAEALDGYRARQSLLLEREQEFSAHLSHELRTPLSVVRAQAELISLQNAGHENLEARANAIMDQVDRMRLLIEQLLRLARSQRSPERRPVALRALVDRLWDELAQGSRSATRLDNQLTARQEVLADPLLLELVLRNVMANARLHANGSLLTVRQEGMTLLLEDSDGTPGVATQGSDAPREASRLAAENGQGIGLSILERACRLLGWGYDVTTTPTGTRVAITLR